MFQHQSGMCCKNTLFLPIWFVVPVNNYEDDVARAYRDLHVSLEHRYILPQNQHIGDQQFLAIQQLKNSSLTYQNPYLKFPNPMLHLKSYLQHQ